MGGMFTWKGRFGPMDLDLSEHTFSPSTVSVLIADALEVEAGDTVIDAGCGSGILSIIAAKLGASRVVGIDIARDTVAVASSTAAKHGVGDVTEFYQGDLFEPLPEDVEADVVIGDVSGIPDDLAAASGWFPGRSGGGPCGSELPIRMLEGVHRILRPGGRVFLPTGTLQDENAIVSNARKLLDRVTKLVERRIPIPNALAESQAAMDLVKRRVIELTPRGSRFTWTARVWVGARP